VKKCGKDLKYCICNPMNREEKKEDEKTKSEEKKVMEINKDELEDIELYNIFEEKTKRMKKKMKSKNMEELRPLPIPPTPIFRSIGKAN
jgi:phenylacetate-coenzyme A ligase PaaK-like adenylate-forming protein